MGRFLTLALKRGYNRDDSFGNHQYVSLEWLYLGGKRETYHRLCYGSIILHALLLGIIYMRMYDPIVHFIPPGNSY